MDELLIIPRESDVEVRLHNMVDWGYPQVGEYTQYTLIHHPKVRIRMVNRKKTRPKANDIGAGDHQFSVSKLSSTQMKLILLGNCSICIQFYI